jgi:RNA polymerase subunit RPABC4/transcription elongation factor Spt4
MYRYKSTQQHFPLDSAYLCQDCNSVGDCSTTCPACASRILLGLATVLDRKDVASAETNMVVFPGKSAILRKVG